MAKIFEKVPGSKVPLSQEFLQRRYRWDAKEKVFRNRDRPAADFTANEKYTAQEIAEWVNVRHADKPLAVFVKDGWPRVRVNGATYVYATFIWIYFKGDIPDDMFVLSDTGERGVVDLDRLVLVPASKARDLFKNQKRDRKKGKSFKRSYASVMWVKRVSKWRVLGTEKGKMIHLGYYTDPEEAEGVAEAFKAGLNLYVPVAEALKTRPPEILGTIDGEEPRQETPTIWVTPHYGAWFKRAQKKWLSFYKLEGASREVGLLPSKLEAVRAAKVAFAGSSASEYALS